jgi:hypothetical protein
MQVVVDWFPVSAELGSCETTIGCLTMHSSKSLFGCDWLAFFGPARPTGCRLGLIGCLHPRRARPRSCNSPPPRLHPGKRPNPLFPHSQALELQARAMAARKIGSARAGGRRGRARGKARVTALLFAPSLLVISSPLSLLSSIFHLVIAIFCSTSSSVSWSLVVEIHGAVTGEYCLPLPPTHLISILICSDSVLNIRVLLFLTPVQVTSNLAQIWFLPLFSFG